MLTDKYFIYYTNSFNKDLKKANGYLDEINIQLEKQAKGYEKAADAYGNELKKLGLSKDQLEVVKNVALDNDNAWMIERFKEEDEELYNTLNEALKYYQLQQEAAANAEETRHKKTLNDIQILQNEYDNLGAKIAKYEAAMSPETSIKKQQKYVTKLIDLYNQQYETQKDIATLLKVDAGCVCLHIHRLKRKIGYKKPSDLMLLNKRTYFWGEEKGGGFFDYQD